MPRLIEISLVIAFGSTALSLLIGVPAGYALARAESRARSALAYFFLVVRTVPPIATLIPFYLMMRDIGLLGTWWAVIIINTALNSAFVVWMMFSYFRAAAQGDRGGGADRRLHAFRRASCASRCRW